MLISLNLNFDEKLLKGGLYIIKKLREKGYEAYFAGGCVRDAILKRKIKDIDIATSAKPEEVKKIFKKTIDVGAKFGVIVVVIDKINYEVTTFRSEGGYSDGRHPDFIYFTCSLQDASRRDFTINGLFYDPLSKSVIDYVGGIKDIEKKIIRTIGNPKKRFEEDKLRMLRAIRFSTVLDFKIEEYTLETIKKFSYEILKVSRERIRDELIKILTENSGDVGLKLLKESNLLSPILPHVSSMIGIPQPEKFHPEGDVFKHTLLMFEKANYPISTTLAFGILLHDIGKPITFRIRDRIRFNNHAHLGEKLSIEILKDLKFSNKVVERVSSLVRNHLKFINVKKMRLSTLKRFLTMENFREHLELHRLDCLASHGNLENYYFCMDNLNRLPDEKLKPEPLISGKDLIKLGLTPSPLFGKILREIETLQLEENIKTKEEAIRHIKEKYLE